MKQEKSTAIVLAAGQGKEDAQQDTESSFWKYEHRPVLYYSL